MSKEIDLKHATTACEVAEIIRKAYRSGDNKLLIDALFRGVPLGSLKNILGAKLWENLPKITVPFFREVSLKETCERYPTIKNLDLWSLEEPRRIFVIDTVLQIINLFDEFKYGASEKETFELRAYKGDYGGISIEIHRGKEQRLGFHFERFDSEDGWSFIDVGKTPVFVKFGPVAPLRYRAVKSVSLTEESLLKGFNLMFKN